MARTAVWEGSQLRNSGGLGWVFPQFQLSVIKTICRKTTHKTLSGQGHGVRVEILL